MNQDVLRSLGALGDYFAGQADRPFGNVESVSGRALQPFSFAGEEAAANLLGKAQRALDDNDLDRARKLAERAARLPFDEHEKVAPAAIVAHMELFNLVTDAVEESEPDDSRWLDAALDVLAMSDELARYEIRDVLADIDHDYELEEAESSRIRSAIVPIPDRVPLRSLELGTTELGDHVMSTLVACRAYRAALKARV